MVAVTIADTGIGIASNKLDGIFRPFVQADKAITMKYGGCGLGLNIVQVRGRTHTSVHTVGHTRSVTHTVTRLHRSMTGFHNTILAPPVSTHGS